MCDSINKLTTKFPDLELIIAGDGKLRDTVEEKVRDTNTKCGRNIIRCIGPCNDVNCLVKDMDIAVGTGRFALEAMAAGKPVVAIANGNDFPGIITPNNWHISSLTSWTRGNKIIAVDTLSSEIEQLLSDPSLLHSLGEFGRDIIRRQFSAEIMTTRLCKLYSEIIANSSRNLNKNK